MNGTLNFKTEEELKDAMNGHRYKKILMHLTSFLSKAIKDTEGFTGENTAYHDVRDELYDKLIDYQLNGEVLKDVPKWTAREVNKDH